MIYITCGTCGTSRGYKTAADGALSLPASEEARLVSRGVAEYATRPIADGDAGQVLRAGETRGDQDSGYAEVLPEAAAADDAPDADEEADEESGDEAARLERMTKAELEQMAKDLGLEVPGGSTKREIAALILSADAPEPDDMEAMV